MTFPPDSVGKGIMFWEVHLPPSSIHSPGQILLPRYLMNGLSSLDETCRKYSLLTA